MLVLAMQEVISVIRCPEPALVHGVPSCGLVYKDTLRTLSNEDKYGNDDGLKKI